MRTNWIAIRKRFGRKCYLFHFSSIRLNKPVQIVVSTVITPKGGVIENGIAILILMLVHFFRFIELYVGETFRIRLTISALDKLYSQ